MKSPLSIGCQTITYGDPQHDRFSEIFSELAEDGYEGLEIGYRRLKNIPASEAVALLKHNGLELLGSHIGGNLEDAGQAKAERSMIDEVLDYLEEVGTPRLMYSGLHFESGEQFRRDLDMIFRSAERCRSRGIRLLYHNHDWEFADGWKVYSPLLAEAPESLHFCVDVGWVEKAGIDALRVLERVGERLEVVHFKDFATTGNRDMDTVVLGTGAIDLPKVSRWLIQRGKAAWIVAEQDVAQGSVSDATRANAAFLRSVLR
jgi:sugar phosphate isomerase/epimerase